MIKAVITDVDGVLVGEKIGFNSPSPHPAVLQKLRSIRIRGIPVILCTAKPYFAISDIIEKAQLMNPHISNAGSIIIDATDTTVLEKQLINPEVARTIIAVFIANGIYTEYYTLHDYFIQQDQQGRITDLRTHILQRAPVIKTTLTDAMLTQEITKITPIAIDETQKKQITDLLDTFSEVITLIWGTLPIAHPLQFGIITPKNISKQEAASTVITTLGIRADDMLGIGDSMMDWEFIKLCGHKAAPHNAHPDLQRLILEQHGYIGPSVDENGILDIFSHFSL